MPITLFTAWENFIGEANTHQGGHVKPNRNFKNWCNTISKDLYNDLIKEFEKTRIISNLLSPFLRTRNIIVSPVPSQMWDVVALPKDYNYFGSARVVRKGGKSCACSSYQTIDGKTGQLTETQCDLYIDDDELALAQQKIDAQLEEHVIDKIKNAQWAAVCEHKTLHPKINNPKCTEYEGGLKLAPKGMGVIILDYFRKQVDAEFKYTIINPNTDNEYIQYDPTSLPLEWDDKALPEFMSRLIKKYGVFVREPFLSQEGEADKKM